MNNLAWGSELGVEDRMYVLRRYYTQQSAGASHNKQDWLNHTQFHVTESGRLDHRFKKCISGARREANEAAMEYRETYFDGRIYISTRPCKDWAGDRKRKS